MAFSPRGYSRAFGACGTRAVGSCLDYAGDGLCDVPVYDPETFETNVSGLHVAGHFTHARHIKDAIAVPRRIVPLIAQSLRAAV